MLNKLLLSLTIASVGPSLALPVSADTASTPSLTTVGAQAVTANAGPLLKPAELRTLLSASSVRVLDIRSDKDYASGHIPGAINTPYGKYRGPKDNPGQLVPEAALTELLRSAGIDQDTHVVVVHAGTDSTDFGAAARVYWALKVGGLKHLSILDGGTKGWKAAGGALDTALPRITPSNFTYSYDQDQIVTRDELADVIGSSTAPLLVDARPARFYSGETRVDAAARYGTLPGAQVLDNAQFFVKDGATLKPANELKALVAQSGAANVPAVSFCNTGHWAATNWFVISEIAGNHAVKLYPASIVDWSKADLPMQNQPSRITALVQDVKRAFQ